MEVKSNHTEDYWIDAFRKGDQKALGHFVQLFSKPLVYFTTRMLQEKEEAEDIVSKCFLKLWQRHADFKNTNNIKAFLYISCRNSCLDYLASLKVRTSVQENYLYHLKSSGENVEYGIVEAEILNLMNQEIEALPEKMKIIFKLLYIEGKSTLDVATELKLSIQTVRNQKTKAIQMIKKSLVKKGISTALQAAILFFFKNI